MIDSSKLAWGYLITIGIIIAGLVGFVFAYRKHQTEAHLAAQGVTVTGYVRYAERRTSRSTGMRNSTSTTEGYYLYVDYLANGAARHGVFAAKAMAFLSHQQGSSIDVIYDPADPANAELAGDMNDNGSGFVAFASGLGLLLGIVSTLYLRITIKQGGSDPSDSAEPGY